MKLFLHVLLYQNATQVVAFRAQVVLESSFYLHFQNAHFFNLWDKLSQSKNSMGCHIVHKDKIVSSRWFFHNFLRQMVEDRRAGGGARRIEYMLKRRKSQRLYFGQIKLKNPSPLRKIDKSRFSISAGYQIRASRIIYFFVIYVDWLARYKPK